MPTNISIKSRRLFIGLPLSTELLTTIGHVRERLSQKTSIRWMPPENLHVTVFFIGKVAEEQMESLRSSLAQIASSSVAFELVPQSYLYMPPRKPRMIWAEFAESSEFTLLVRTIEEHIGHLREEAEPKEPRPHVTLARMKYLAPKDRVGPGNPPPVTLQVKALNLYESFLSSEGSRYEVVESFQMKVEGLIPG